MSHKHKNKNDKKRHKEYNQNLCCEKYTYVLGQRMNSGGEGGGRAPGVSIWADLWGGVSVHGIIYDIYYVILIMNTDYAQIVP